MDTEFTNYPAAFRCTDLSLDNLQRDYDFYSNAYAEGGSVWWATTTGGGRGGPLDNFLGVLRMDNNYAFGPVKKQKGWSLDRLKEKNAIGVYKLKAARIPGSITTGI